ncbi:MAG TPA: DUF4190 domain-containing protein [Ktedonobacterales bacterium]|nr:DUF4190 domain-containing protein [Ktedonobacterales bacterium]
MPSDSTPDAPYDAPHDAPLDAPAANLMDASADATIQPILGDPYTYPPYFPYPPYQPNSPYPPYQPYPPGAGSASAPYAYPAPYPWMFAPPEPRLGTWALVSMICGVVSVVTLQWIVAILAIVFGFIGLSEVKKSAGTVEGRGFALAGIITGFVAIGIGVAIVALYIIFYIVFFLTLYQTMPG